MYVFQPDKVLFIWRELDLFLYARAIVKPNYIKLNKKDLSKASVCGIFWYHRKTINKSTTKPAFTYSKLTIETLE